MDFLAVPCSIEQHTCCEDLIELLQMGPDYNSPVGIVIIGGTDHLQKELLGNLKDQLVNVQEVVAPISLLGDRGNVQYCTAGLDDIDYGVVRVRGDLGSYRRVRQDVIADLRAKGFDTAMLMWLRPDPDTVSPGCEINPLMLDASIEKSRPNDDAVNCVVTLKFDPKSGQLGPAPEPLSTD